MKAAQDVSMEPRVSITWPRRVDRVAYSPAPKHSRFYIGHTLRIAFRTVLKHGRCQVLSFSPTQFREGTLQGEDPSGPGRLRLKETSSQPSWEAEARLQSPAPWLSVTCLHLCVVMAHQLGASDHRCPANPCAQTGSVSQGCGAG